MRYSKVIAKEKRKKQHGLESKLQIFEKSLSCDRNIEEYHKWKTDLDETYDNIAERVKIKGHEESKKSTKYFLNLGKKVSRKIYYTKISN